jgi:hypothetical protein
MFVSLSEDDGLRLIEPYVFTSLSARPSEQLQKDLNKLARVVAPFGTLDGDRHIWLRVSALGDLGPCDPTWRQGFEKMVEFAVTKGWTRNASSEVRLHVQCP